MKKQTKETKAALLMRLYRLEVRIGDHNAGINSGRRELNAMRIERAELLAAIARARK